ncbi:hypothetical protein MVEN_00061700 [Mycena venus]|uniref:Uncharacterized protein n=1 Tax=Mycena venus TaxID=2733690 RepID=A0A8H6Z7J0_9AGAR|nr:hypothetical protein MVEN_00061700 [Mycena venus]
MADNHFIKPSKQARRTATTVLAGDFDARPPNDVLPSLLNGPPRSSFPGVDAGPIQLIQHVTHNLQAAIFVEETACLCEERMEGMGGRETDTQRQRNLKPLGSAKTDASESPIFHRELQVIVCQSCMTDSMIFNRLL